MNGKCSSNNTLYTATLASSNKNYEPRAYKGIYETNFRLRYANHKKPLNLQNYIKITELSIEYWKLTCKIVTPNITWNTYGKYASYNPE